MAKRLRLQPMPVLIQAYLPCQALCTRCVEDRFGGEVVEESGKLRRRHGRATSHLLKKTRRLQSNASVMVPSTLILRPTSVVHAGNK
jgi:hypothetical protein